MRRPKDPQQPCHTDSASMICPRGDPPAAVRGDLSLTVCKPKQQAVVNTAATSMWRKTDCAERRWSGGREPSTWGAVYDL
ncbi:hypothetical protein NDU88_010288 [Pleurodeles waltl]|uniref:Uncharacterized protein n=1 Tax=Pleurodeles waltl TaxID=8319 RepID=A0AAV7S0U8_PLEWA|nr:hypothetical protein NDU88_010288 [Pleurodeles waltl]